MAHWQPSRLRMNLRQHNRSNDDNSLLKLEAESRHVQARKRL
jgi:hypothetical protein